VNLYEFLLDDGSRNYELTAVVAAECLTEAEVVLSGTLIGDFAGFRPSPGHMLGTCPIAAVVFSGNVNKNRTMPRLLRPVRRLWFKFKRA
jgi:hypothetical protein